MYQNITFLFLQFSLAYCIFVVVILSWFQETQEFTSLIFMLQQAQVKKKKKQDLFLGSHFPVGIAENVISNREP